MSSVDEYPPIVFHCDCWFRNGSVEIWQLNALNFTETWFFYIDLEYFSINYSLRCCRRRLFIVFSLASHTYSPIHIHNQNSNKIKYESLPSLFDKSGKQREISRESDDKQRQQTNKHWHGWITRSSYGERGKAVWYHWIIEIWIESSNRNGMILYNIWCTPPSQINNIFVRSIALEIDFGGWFFVVCLGMRCSSNIFGPDWQNCLYSIFAIQLQSNANYLNKSKLIGAFADWHFAWIYNQIFRFLMCHSDIPMIWWSNVATIPVP